MIMFRILGILNLIGGFVGGLISFIIMAHNDNADFGFGMFIIWVCVGCIDSMICFGFQSIVDILKNIDDNLTSLKSSNHKEANKNDKTYGYICDSLEYIVNYLNNKSK